MESNSAGGTINYPISIGYRPNWGDWEAVREIVQNAIDTSTRVTVKYKDGCLIIKDKGDGFILKNLIIGESSKNGIDSIGKFGEGMKFAILSLLRDGRSIKIYTNNIILNTRLVDTFDVKTLCIDYSFTNIVLKGTKVVIEGIENDYSSRFLSYNLTKNMVERILPDKPGELFIKGIFVKAIESEFGYNLNMERENPITGDVDHYEIRDRIAKIICSNKDRKYASYILKIASNTEYHDSIERECNIWMTLRHPNIWRDEVKNLFGNKVCLQTDIDVSRSAKYSGFTIINSSIQYAHYFFKNDVEVIKNKVSNKKNLRISIKDLSDYQFSNVKKMKMFINDIIGVNVKDFRIIEFDDDNILGEAKHGKFVSISRKVINDWEKFLGVVMHEMVHYIYGYADLSEEFQNAFESLTSKVIVKLQNSFK